MKKFDEIQKAKHYNSHPSGVECKDIARHLGFDLGNAVKYLWRMHEKHADPLPDLRKAAFYVQDYIDNVVNQHLLPAGLPRLGASAFSEARVDYDDHVKLLISAETDATAGIFWALVLPDPAKLNAVKTALAVIQNRIVAEDKAPAWEDTEEGPITVTAKDFS